LTLPGLIADALGQRPLLAADQARVGAARARVTQAHSALLPRVDAQGSITDGPIGSPPLGLGGLVGTPAKIHYGASLNLVQTLLDFGRAQNTVRARQAEVQSMRAGERVDEDRVVLDVQQAYFQALQAQRLLAVNRQILEERRLVARQAETFRENGFATRLDVDLAELNVSQAQLAVVRSQNDIDTAFATLSAATGREIPAPTPLEDIAPPAPVPGAPPPSAEAVPGLEEAVSAALRDRPEVRQIEAQVRASERLAQAARAGNRPYVNAVASVGKINPPDFAPKDKIYAIGAGVTVPIFTAGLVRGQVAEAQRNAAAARASLAELQNQIRQQVASAVANLAASEAALRTAQAQRVSAEDALRLATERYRAQLGTIVELSQAQVGYATAENDYVRALYDRELARAALAFATGSSLHEEKTPGANP
jgi:outer membrane protein